MSVEADSATETPNNTAVTNLTSTDPLTWQLGSPDGSGARFVDAGDVFEVRFSAIVTAAPVGEPEVLTNRVKLAGTNTDGTVGNRRDDVGFSVAPAPAATVEKSATRTSDPAGPLADGAQVVAGDQVAYTVAVGNDGTAAAGNDEPIVGPDVWDVLPDGITCADVSAISDTGVCTDPGQPGQPSFDGNDTSSAVRWDLPESVTIAPGATYELGYTTTIPADASVSLTYTNTAAVASYGTGTKRQTVVQHRPADNIDNTTPADEVDAPAAQDTFTVVTPGLALTKTNVSAIDAPGNRGPPDNGQPSQAVIGEEVTYTITGTVPARTTVYDGGLTDALPAGLELLSSSVASSLDGGAFTPGAPGTFDSDTASLELPDPYTTDGTADRFEITVVARVTTVGSSTNGGTLTNTATFSATRGPGGSTVETRATSPVEVVEPAPTLAKTDDAAGDVSAQQAGGVHPDGRQPGREADPARRRPRRLRARGPRRGHAGRRGHRRAGRRHRRLRHGHDPHRVERRRPRRR